MMRKGKLFLITVVGIMALSLCACGKAADDKEPGSIKEEKTKNFGADVELDPIKAIDDVDVPASDGGEEEDVLSEIEGLWSTVHQPADLHVFAGDQDQKYSVVLDENMEPTGEYTQGEVMMITSVEKVTDETGEYYKIFLDNDTIYFWYPDRPDDLECHWEPDGYSASDSLMRQTGSIKDYKIAE